MINYKKNLNITIYFMVFIQLWKQMA